MTFAQHEATLFEQRVEPWFNKEVHQFEEAAGGIEAKIENMFTQKAEVDADKDLQKMEVELNEKIDQIVGNPSTGRKHTGKSKYQKTGGRARRA